MEVPAEVRHPILKSVLVYAVAALVLSFISGLASHSLAASHLPSYLLSVLVDLACIVVPTVAGAGWFKINMERGMSGADRLSFASGVIAANLILNVGGTGLFLLLAGPVRTAKWGGAGAFFERYVDGNVFTLAYLFSQVLIFVQAYFVGWIMIRNKANERRRELERVFGDT